MKYFTIAELSRSDTARRLNINNIPASTDRDRMERLIDNVLDPLREAWGKPIYVNSGFRSPALNRAVGGASGSMHLSGRAADITAGSAADNRRLYDLAVSLRLPFYELIGEKYGFGWIHVSHCPERAQRKPS